LEKKQEGMRQLMENLGNPQAHLPPLFHITGTNGKGSTAGFISACLEEMGWRVHRYTSPHLLSWTERIRLANGPISEDALLYYLDLCEKKQGEQGVSWFQALTAAAFLAFKDHPADVVVMEVGIGGAFDATNVVQTTCASVFTSISLDHTDLLGTSLSSIAATKAGILRSGIPCISAWQPKEARLCLQKKAKALHCPFFSVHQKNNGASNGFTLRILETLMAIPLDQLSLQGAHQKMNAKTAIAALSGQSSFTVSHAALKKGITKTHLPGRLQPLKGAILDAFPPGSEIWVDCAHNEGGAMALKKHILQSWSNADAVDALPLILVFGMLARKDHRFFWHALAPLSLQSWGVSHFGKDESAVDHAIFSSYARETHTPYVGFSTFAHLIKEHPLRAPARLLCCGSFYFIGDILRTCGMKYP
jgi:dihydrofolate synthase/folylpolyglutamate synthase